MTVLQKPLRPLDGATFASVAVAAAIALFLSDWDSQFLVENGPTEMIQLALLASAALLFCRAGIRLAEWGGLTALVLASLTSVAFVREIPRCDSAFYEFGPCFADGPKDLAYTAAGLLVLLLLVLNPELRLAHFRRLAFSNLPNFLLRASRLLLLLLPAAGSVLAESYGHPGLEELLETAAYALLALFALEGAQAGDMRMNRPKATAGAAAPARGHPARCGTGA